MNRFLACALCALILTVGLVGSGVGTAAACSCEQNDSSTLDRSDGAFAGIVGVVSDVEGEPGEEFAYLATIDVHFDLKDNLADSIRVRSYDDDGGNCGLGLRPGDQVEAVIRVDPEGWFLIDGCSLIPSSLLFGWSPPSGRGGSAELFVTTYGGPYRFVAFGPSGDRLAFGSGRGRTELIGLCDGDQTLVEIVRHDDRPESTIELRSLATFEVVQTVPLLVERQPLTATEVSCSQDLGEIAVTARPTDRPGPARDYVYSVYSSGLWIEADSDRNIQTRSERRPADWPSIEVSAGEIEMQNNFDAVFALDVMVEVPAVEVEPPYWLGQGFDDTMLTDGFGSDASPADIVLLFAGRIAVVLLFGCIVYVLVVRQNRT